MLKRELGWYNCSFLMIVVTIAMAMLASGFRSVGEQVDSSNNSSFPIALPNCPYKCGDVHIPYPFGIGDDCHYNHPQDGSFYKISCKSNVPYYGRVVVENITLQGEIRVRCSNSYACYDSKMMVTKSEVSSSCITRFAISTTENIIGAIGCDSFGVLYGTSIMNGSLELATGCFTRCNNPSEVSTSCSGFGCCQIPMTKAVTNITTRASSQYYHQDVLSFNPCNIAFVVAKRQGTDELPFSIKDILKQNVSYFDNPSNLVYPRVYNWSIGTKSCAEALLDKKHYLCKANSTCQDLPDQWGYRCQCLQGFKGNPYLNACEDDNECSGVNNCTKPAWCVNIRGGYDCICPSNHVGGGTISDPCVPVSNKRNSTYITIAGGVGGGVIFILTIAFCVDWLHGKRELKRLRESFFHENGGHILQQKLAGRDVSVGNTVEMFNIKQLKKATDNFSQYCVIGKGGFGMVYKGNLTRKAETTLAINQVVAIKKSLKVDSTQVEQFINEIIALSQINNKNVVKLLGCCLETEMPLLVYEFISNGTLSEHLHDESKACFLTWDDRLRIATEVSEVLAYLHTTISIPIIHRDIKSANILLDESYTAKVADFGASKLAPVDLEQLATTVQGTWGYLDPEYMQTGELTDKSDVYSFGVVLVELLTRKRAISYVRLGDDRCLAYYFLRKLNDDRLFEILDNNLLKGGDIMDQQLKKVSHIAKRCLEVKGEDRPTMKEVARDLNGIKSEVSSHSWLNNEGLELMKEGGSFLGETHIINEDYSNEAPSDDRLSKQTSVAQPILMDEGR